MIFSPSNYFDLSHFAHAQLFASIEQVWEALEQIEIYLKHLPLGKIEGEVSPHAHLENPSLISIGKGTVIEAGAYLRGPCYIGEECEVRHGAYIRGNCLTGDRCVIGHATEVKNALFLDEAQAGHFAYVGDTILGNRVNLGAGTKCANLRLDQKTIYVSEGIDTRRRKFGAIIGDEAQLGCNCVTNPGTLLGKQSRCYPCTNIGGTVPDKGIVKLPIMAYSHDAPS